MFKTALLSAISTALDYYDFVIYIMLASFIAPAFFADHSAFTQYISVLGIFAAGYIARPLGGLLFGHFADRYGRKKVFLSSILLMAAATFSLGLLPDYAQIGRVCVLLLLTCRLAQGLAQGAEIPGAITFIAEHAPAHQRGQWVGLTLAGAGIGAALASLISTLLLHFFSIAEMRAFGWRIPFYLGGILALVGFMIRKHSTEPLLFLDLPVRCKTPFLNLMQHHKIAVLQGIGVIALPGSLILFGLFLPNYLLLHYDYPLPHTYFIFTWSLIESSCLIILSGKLIDRFGLKRIFISLILLSAISIIPLFRILTWQSDTALWLFLCTYEGLIGLMAGCYPPLLAHLFPTKIRMTGVAFSYNAAYLLLGFVPMLALAWIQFSHSAQSVSLIFIVMGLISFLCCISVKTPHPPS